MDEYASSKSATGESLNFFKEHFYILGEFDDTISRHVTPYLVKEIDKKSGEKDAKIRFYINSIGGYVKNLQELLSLIDLAKSRGIIVETYVLKEASSCGSLLAIYGTKGHRYVGRYATHLVHLGSAGTHVRNEIEFARQNEDVKAHFKFIKDMYKTHAKIKDLDKHIKDDWFFVRGQDMIKLGLADKFIGENEAND